MKNDPIPRLPNGAPVGALPGDILVTRAPTLLSWWCRFASASEWGHAALIGHNGNVFEATGRGIAHRSWPYSIRPWTEWQIHRIGSTSPEWQAKVRDIAEACLDTPYGYFDVVGLFANSLRGRGAHNPWNTKKQLICSEFVAQVYQDAGTPIYRSIPPGDVTPGMLADVHQVRGSNFIHFMSGRG